MAQAASWSCHEGNPLRGHGDGGQGVLRECLRDDGVEGVLAVGRSSSGRAHPKLRELIRKDLFDFGAASADLRGYDACFFCLGISSAGMSETDYTPDFRPDPGMGAGAG